MKYCVEKYPMGSFKGQKSPGKYMDGWLYQNLELLATKIVKDMTFLGVIYSSTLEVGTGKSVLATQIGEAWSDVMKKKHNIDIPYSVENICWKPKDLIEKSFNVPKYSYILLDEWEDASYWSELGMTLRQFFRKCRQLNLFMICIIPNWFQLPLSYAVSRSMFAIDVRFTNDLERGLFAFYNFPAKRILYIAGKRGHNYRVVKPTFMGRFGDGYGVDEQEYRQKKLQDMEDYDRENPIKKTKAMIEKDVKIEFLQRFKKNAPNLSTKELANILAVSEDTIRRWIKGSVSETAPLKTNYNNKHTIKEYEQDDEALEGSEQKEIDESEPVNPISTEGTGNMGRSG